VSLEAQRIRRDFPVLQRRLDGKLPIYLDSACTSLRPEPVVQAMARFQLEQPGCHGRANHLFGRQVTAAYEQARADVARFVGAAQPTEIVFLRNTTEAINLLASCLALRPGDRVLCSSLEHNSNLLPWLRLTRTRRIRHVILPVDPARGFSMDALIQELKQGARLVSLLQVSNLCGIAYPIAEICAEAHRHGAWVLADGAQAVCSHEVDVQALGVDFYTFSFHKMFGPAGIGALYGRQELLERLPPYLVGGDTIEDTSYQRARWAKPPQRFEAGIPNYAGAVGAAAAIRYLQGIGQAALRQHVVALNRRASEGLLASPRVRLIGPVEAERRGGVLNFHVQGLGARGLASLLDRRAGIMVRYGKHCVNAWYQESGLPDSLRVSFSAYNTEDEADQLVATVLDVISMLG